MVQEELMADPVQFVGRDPGGDRATDLWQQALAEYEEPPMDPAIREELEAYVAKRREEIGHDEP